MISKLLLMALMLLSVPVYADNVKSTTENAVTIDTLGTYSTIAVPTTTSVFTRTVSLLNANGFVSTAIMYKATSSGVINLSLQAERSFDVPTTQGSADSKYVAWNGPALTTDSQWHMATLDTVILPYFRYKITGIGSNDASTTVQIKVVKQ